MNPIEAAKVTDAPQEGETLVFQTPWEARIFALIANMATNDRFQWDEFKEELISQIAADNKDDASCDLDSGSPYYRSWLAAAESLFSSLDVCSPAELETRIQKLSDPNAPGKNSPTGHSAAPVSVE
jgi:nitrile hydratase accessory protein